jgi:hypothetical protein
LTLEHLGTVGDRELQRAQFVVGQSGSVEDGERVHHLVESRTQIVNRVPDERREVIRHWLDRLDVVSVFGTIRLQLSA